MTTFKQATSQLRRKLYMAVGAIQGQYQPSGDNFTQGILLANDGTKFPALLHDKLEQQLKQQPELLNTQQFFGVWPSTSASEPELFLKLKSIRKEDQQQPGLLEADVDQFSICGVVVSQDKSAGKIVIQIKRNGKTPAGLEQAPEWQPFNLEISGKLPDDAVEQFWQLSCHRDGERLVMTDASLFVKAPRPESLPKADETLAPPTSPLDEFRDKADTFVQHRLRVVPTDIPKRVSAYPAENVPPSTNPDKTGQPLYQTDMRCGTEIVDGGCPVLSRFIGPPEVTPSAQTSFAFDNPAASTRAGINPTPGKMEVAVKLNQFPNNVQTVDKGWKEFEVDTGSCIVTISVKPKIFASLEQAQQTYPLWLAAISGQMGSATGSGFRLESPAYKVFERKPSISSQQQQTTRLKSSLQGPTPGKMEIVIKINEFPASVRTVENGWREFDVDSGDRIITITVKPKVFKKLEIAQENYPMWVAAITGQMGERTDRGFVLLDPNIQVFERQRRDSATAYLAHTKDNSSPSPATESQQSPPETTPETTKETTQEQQSVALHDAEPQQQPSYAANPMQRTKEHLKQL
jgi:hypothetical protein